MSDTSFAPAFDHPWDAAARLCVARPLDRETNFFVLALEQLGARVHDARIRTRDDPDFFVEFSAPYELARVVGAVGVGVVEIGRARDRWRLTLGSQEDLSTTLADRLRLMAFWWCRVLDIRLEDFASMPGVSSASEVPRELPVEGPVASAATGVSAPTSEVA